MPMCTYPLGCDKYAVRNNVRCSDHLTRNATERKKEAAMVKQFRADEANRAKLAEEHEARSAKATKLRDAQIAKVERQAKVIREHVQRWEALIDDIEAQVIALRATIPGANAGQNNGADDIPGGNTNEIRLLISGPSEGVTVGEICRHIAGFDSSDSGCFKFRRATGAGNGSNILIHCR